MKTLKKINVQRTDRINRIGMGGMNLSRTQLKKKKGGGGVCKRRSSSEGRGSLFRKWEEFSSENGRIFLGRGDGRSRGKHGRGIAAPGKGQPTR